MSKLALNVFLAKESCVEFDSVVHKKHVRKKVPVRNDLGFEGVICFGENTRYVPKWLDWLRNGIEDDIHDVFNSSTRAVLLVRTLGRIFALAFGHGRFMLASEALVLDFGIRVTLNGVDPDSLRAMDTVTIADIILHEKKQTSRQTSIRTFRSDDLDSLLQRLTGTPRNSEYGTSISGRESVKLTTGVEFDNITTLCKKLYSLYISDRYREHFSWYDNVRSVSDPELVDALDGELLEAIQQNDHDRFYLAPPEVIDWETIDGFSFTSKGPLWSDLCAKAYLDYFRARERDVRSVKTHYVFARSDMDIKHKWRVYNCIVYETTRGDDTYVLFNGHWFRVQKDFAALVNDSVKRIPGADISLPPCYIGEKEFDYNVRASRETGFLCLDAKTIGIGGNQVEVCDLLTDKNQLIHIKKWRSSASLSHLFLQGTNSAESLLRDESFRLATRQLIEQTKPGFPTAIHREGAGELEVVFGIVYSRDVPVHKRLPFFSKLSMMDAAKALHAQGVKVSVTRIAEIETRAEAV